MQPQSSCLKRDSGTGQVQEPGAPREWVHCFEALFAMSGEAIHPGAASARVMTAEVLHIQDFEAGPFTGEDLAATPARAAAYQR